MPLPAPAFLERRGWTLLLVPFFEFYELQSSEERADYMRLKCRELPGEWLGGLLGCVGSWVGYLVAWVVGWVSWLRG